MISGLFLIYSSFSISIIEEIFFVIPSTLAQLSLGGLMIGQTLSITNTLYFLLFIVIPAAAGISLGSIPIFLIARCAFHRTRKRHGKLQKVIESVKASFDAKQKVSKSLFFLMRLLPNFSSLVATIIGGFWGLSIKTFLIITFFGSIIRVFIIAFVGWQASHYIYLFTGKHGWTGFFAGIFILIALSTILLYKKPGNTN